MRGLPWDCRFRLIASVAYSATATAIWPLASESLGCDASWLPPTAGWVVNGGYGGDGFGAGPGVLL